jgi:bifunctional DNA-binding transcriptional regulator/antitoxin component of YhaV-PrlF toxin-antitoxin module
VPEEVRRRLGVGVGSVLEWSEQNGQIVVRKAGRFSSAEVHAALFATARRPKSAADMRAAISKHMRRRNALD